jgi:hypothetical protein
MNLRYLLALVGLAAVVLIVGPYLKSKAEPESQTVWRIIAYQSYDNRMWEILGVRDTNGVLVDTVIISPSAVGPAEAMNFSEPIIMGEGSLLFCAMLAHKQVLGDSAYILVRKSTNLGDTWSTLATIGKDQGIARHLSAAYDPDSSLIHLVWEDCRSGFWRIYYEKVTNL